MQQLLHWFHAKGRPTQDNRLARDAAFIQFPRTAAARERDPWRVDFWRGTLPRTIGVEHLLAVSHLRQVPGRTDRRQPHPRDDRATHEFFLLFVEPPNTERKLVWRQEVDLGHDLLRQAIDAYNAAKMRYSAIADRDDSHFGAGLQAAARAQQEMGKARAKVAAVERQLDLCARQVCEAIALAMETASLVQLIRQDRDVEQHWGEIAGFAALQCPWQMEQKRKTPLSSMVVKGWKLD